MMGRDGWRFIVVCHKACRRKYVVLTTSSMKGGKHYQGCGALFKGKILRVTNTELTNQSEWCGLLR